MDLNVAYHGSHPIQFESKETGRVYLFQSAGSVLAVDERDWPMMEHLRTSGCCGRGTRHSFEVIGRLA